MASKLRDIARMMGKTEAQNPDNQRLLFFGESTIDSAETEKIVETASMAVYSSLDSLPITGLAAGKHAYVSSNNRYYISNGTGWYNVATANATPYWDSEPLTTYTITDSVTPLIITAKARDSDNSDQNLFHQSTVTDSAAFLVDITRDSSVYTFTPKSQDSISSSVTLGDLTDSYNNDFVYTFKWSDGINFVSKDVTINYNFAEPASNPTVRYVVVAGGGGTVTDFNGGGGAGGMLEATGVTDFVAGTTYTVTVGGGGARSTDENTHANSGSDSTISGSGLTTITAVGGGRGTRKCFNTDADTAPSTGGSGGGGGRNNGHAGAAGTSGQGNGGGKGSHSNNCGGGGGKSAAGGNGSNGIGGTGGNGKANDITGSSVTYAGGGGGGCAIRYGGTAGGSGGTGGGGNGSNGSAQGGGGGTNLGGGGGGGGRTSELYGFVDGGSGGSGVVIIRCDVQAASTTGSPTETTVNGEYVYKFTGSGTIAW